MSKLHVNFCNAEHTRAAFDVPDDYKLTFERLPSNDVGEVFLVFPSGVIKQYEILTATVRSDA